MTSPEGARADATAIAVASARADVPVLVELMHEFYAESAYSLDREWAARSFSALLADRSLGAVWIARAGSEPAGYVVLTLRFAMEHGGLQGAIEDLFVRAVHRRAGCATALLHALVAECRRRGVVALSVEVAEANETATALYRRLGLARRTDGRVVLSGPLDA